MKKTTTFRKLIIIFLFIGSVFFVYLAYKVNYYSLPFNQEKWFANEGEPTDIRFRMAKNAMKKIMEAGGSKNTVFLLLGKEYFTEECSKFSINMFPKNNNDSYDLIIYYQLGISKEYGEFSFPLLAIGFKNDIIKSWYFTVS